MLNKLFDKADELKKLSLEIEVQLMELKELIDNYMKGVDET